MDVQKDFQDLCFLLNASGVDRLIMGGYAVGFHGVPRVTGYLDVFVRPARQHIERMLAALQSFGFPTASGAPEQLLEQRKILQLGAVRVQVHIMTGSQGIVG